MTKPPILAIVGPTAVGKTALSLALARHLPVEIISVDSRQVYRGMDTGTAKPTSSERAKVPHHLIDIADPKESFGLAEYLALARTAIQGICRRGRVPLLVGGTGQYLWALLEAWHVPSVPPDRQFRRNQEALAEVQGVEALHRRLAQVDSPSAERIDRRNVRRVIRALEIHHQTGIPASKLRRQSDSPYQACIIGLTLPRRELYRRIDERVERMVEQGWIGEVQALLDDGVARDSPAMAGVGYGELAAHIQGELSLEEAIQNTKTSAHRFARRQHAWFRPSDPRIRWLQAGSEAEERAGELIAAFLREVS